MRILKTCQQEINNSQQPYPIAPLRANPEVIAANLSPAEIKILNSLIESQAYYEKDYRSQTTIAQRAGYRNRKTYQRAIKKLIALKLVKVINRGVKKTCLYILSPWFRDPFIKARLSPFLKALKILPLLALLSPSITDAANIDSAKNVPQKIYENLKVSYFNILKPSSTDRLTQVSSHTTKKMVPAYLVRPILFGDSGGGVSKKEKKENVMNANPIPQAIRDIAELPLTKWGQIKLSAFPEQAIRYARFELSKVNPTDPFAWFFGVCLKFCQRNGIAPDWEKMVTLSRTYKMPDNALMLLASDNEYYASQANHKKLNSSIKYNNITQAVNKNAERGRARSASCPQLSVTTTNEFVLQKKLQAEKVEQEDPYTVMKKMDEERLHKERNDFYLIIRPSFLEQLSADQQKQLLNEVHSDCSCPFSINRNDSEWTGES